MTGLYDDAPYKVRENLAQAHLKVLHAFVRPGTWWSGEQRAALISEVRSARSPVGFQGFKHVELTSAVKRLLERIAVAPNELDRSAYDEALAGGLSAEEYVETVSLVAQTINLDDFSRGLGIALRELPAVEDGQPSRLAPSEAVLGDAWLPMVPSGQLGGVIGEQLYGKGWAANILRALSLVPSEASSIIELEAVEYCSPETIMDFGFSHDPAISRSQVELVAARISALNQCFY